MKNAPPRILIITNGHLCRNPRVFKEASALGSAGYNVTVLGVRNHPPSVPLDRDLADGAPFTHGELKLIGSDSSPAGKFLILLRRLQQRVAREFAQHTRWQSIESLGPAHALLKMARSIPSDLVIVHNEIAHWVGARLIADGRKVCADFEDWHSEDLLPADRVSRPLALITNVEKTLLHQAVHTTTTSQALAHALHRRYAGKTPHIITNSFPLQSRPEVEKVGQPPSFFWFSQTIGPGRGLEPFVAAWLAMQHDSQLVLLGEPVDGYIEQLFQAASSHKRSMISVISTVAPEALPEVIARHDIGLALEQSSIVNRDLTITNKILQYLNAGLAIVASDTAGQREVLSRSPEAGLIINLDDSQALAQKLDSLLANRDRLIARKQAARQLAETAYCWEHESPRLVQLVSKIVPSP